MVHQTNQGLPVADSNAGRPVLPRKRLMVRLVVLWIGLNGVIWFVPGIWQTGRQWYQSWERERQAAFYETRSFTLGDGDTVELPYLFYAPPVQATAPARVKFPLVIVLHGSGERGRDCRGQLATVETFLVERSFQSRHPCYVLAPQCPQNASWRSSNGRKVERAVAGLLEQLIAAEAIDVDRIYLIGYSMGAFGCWRYATTMPERFAACIAVAGGGDPSAASKIVGTPVWAIHGKDDSVIPHQSSRQMVHAVRAAGGTAKLTSLPGVGHESFHVVRQTPNAYLQWMFQQRKQRQAER